MNPDNHKFEITDIAHPAYPFLHRIRALRDIGEDVKAGDLGGYVEQEGNLSYEDSGCWIYDDAIAANGASVSRGAVLRDHAVACGDAKITGGAVMAGHAWAEDHSLLDGARMEDHARISGCGTAFAITPDKAPVLGGSSIVHGNVVGNIRLTGEGALLNDERVFNGTIDRIVIDEKGRRLERSPERGKLVPSAEYFGQNKPKPKRKQKGVER